MIIFNFVKARCFSIISGKCARDRVCKMFSLEKREEKLIETLNNLVKSEE